MLKSKVGIWILAIIVSLIVFNRGNIGNFFKNLFYEGQKEIVTIQVKEDDSILRSKIGDSGSFRINEDLYFKFSIIDNVFEDSLADVIIERNSEKGYENYIISNNFPELGEVFKRLGLYDEISGYFLSR